jgi:hypothetical protein
MHVTRRQQPVPTRPAGHRRFAAGVAASLALVGTAIGVSPATAAVSIDPSSGPVTLTTAGEYEFVIPSGVSHVAVDLTGGVGGGSGGGRAARITAWVPVSPGMVASVVVGANGAADRPGSASPFAGGGAGTGTALELGTTAYSGGGATTLMLDGVTMVVAGGGGGQGGDGTGNIFVQGIGGDGGDAGLPGADAADGACGYMRSDPTYLGGAGGLGASSSAAGVAGPPCDRWRGEVGLPGVADRGGNGGNGATVPCGSGTVHTAGPGGGGGGGRFGGAGGGAGYVACQLVFGQFEPATGGGGGGGGSSYASPGALRSAQHVAIGSRAVVAYVTSTVVDATPPMVTPTVTGQLGTGGWYTGDVSVNWTVFDNETAVSSQAGCAPTTIATDIADLILTCTATSAGGTTTKTVNIRRDATAPALAPVATPNPVALGEAVTVAANADDALSGLATSSCDPPASTTPGPASVMCTATDLAGNIASAAASYTVIVVDTTAPIVTPTVSGPLGANGWYTGDVGVSWTAVDDESDVSVQSGCDPAIVSTDTTGLTLTCTATSAGGTTTETVTVKRDATAPTLAPVVSPSPAVRGAALSVTANAADALSGVASSICGPVDSSTVGARTVTCTAVDNAGNTATASATYQVQWAWRGFIGFRPLPTMNQYLAGLPVPLAFSLGGNAGLAIIDGAPTSQRVNCSTGAPIGSPATADPRSTLSYVQPIDTYAYLWRTDRTWRGTCRVFTLSLSDGTAHSIGFNFR